MMRLFRRQAAHGLTVAFACVLAMGIAGPAPAQERAVLVVTADLGGDVGRRQARIRELRREGQRVELRGTCLSACTMYLGLPNVCVDPAARFGFHGPYGRFGHLPTDAFDHWSRVISDRFLPPLRQWFMSSGRHGGRKLKLVKGAELIRMGYTRC